MSSEQALAEHIAHLGMSDESEDAQATELDPIIEETSEPEEDYYEEQPEQYDTADEGTTTTEAQQAEIDYQAEYEKVVRESAGRLGTIGQLREQLRSTADNIENLRQVVLEQQKQKQQEELQKRSQKQLEEELERYGENVVNDPHIAYMRDKLDKIAQQNQREAQIREGRMRALQEEQQRRAEFEQQRSEFINQLKTQEDSFREAHPDYEDAYEFARNKRKEMYTRRGHSAEQAEAIVAEEEVYLAQEQLMRGGNVAEEVYNWARDYGWEEPAQEQGQAQRQRPSDPSDFDKIRQGIRSASVRSLNSNAPRHDGEYVSIEQFYATVPEHIRAQVHADPDMFEQLGRYGKIKKFW